MITQLNTPLPSPKHVSVLAMNFSFHCCLFEFRTKWTLNVSQSSQNEKIRFLKRLMLSTQLSRVCFERYGVSNEVVSSYRDHHKTISCVAQCGLYLASRLNIYCLQWAPSVKLIMYHMAAEELWHLPTHSESCHINIQIFSRLPQQLAGLCRLNTSPCYLLLFKSFHIFGFINQMTGCY